MILAMVMSLVAKPVIAWLCEMASATPAGAFVELGVYKGGTAFHLAKIARDQGRKLYLFDTFSGMPFSDAGDSHRVGDFAEEFLLGSGKNILDQEILTSIFVPIKGKNSGAAFKKLMRTSQDLAKVSVAVSIVVEGGRCRDIRIVLGAVADKVFRAKKAESILRGEQITERTIKEVAQKAAMEAQPITDVRSTAEYRSHVIKVLVDRLVRLSVERAEGKCG